MKTNWKASKVTKAGAVFFSIQIIVLFTGITYAVLELQHPARAMFAMWFFTGLWILSVGAGQLLSKFGVILLEPDER